MTDRDTITLPREVAYQVPLHELLESVPSDARLVIDDADGMGTAFIPVGRYCHEAAAALRTHLAAPPEDKTHPGYVIGSHWLETAYSRVCAGEAEADVLRDIGLVREEAFLLGVQHLREEVTLAERLASGRLAMVEQLTEEVVSLTATRDRQSAMLRRLEEREAELDAEIGRLTKENERLRDELRQSSIDFTRAEVERLREQIKDCDGTIEALQSAVARAAQKVLAGT